MSRDKFEEWVKEFDIDSVREWQFAHTAWIAGRESMKRDAEKACADIGTDAYKAFHAIHNIEP